MERAAGTGEIATPPWDIAGKRCLVTGATNGIGRTAALALARAGADIVVSGREVGRIAAVQQQIADETGRRPGAFLSDFKSLAELRARRPRLLGTAGKPCMCCCTMPGRYSPVDSAVPKAMRPA